MGVTPRHDDVSADRDAGCVRWRWATLVANIGIVVTGGAVRLTGSGLGCPTWPRCTDESFRPHGALDLHEAIEFGNRMLTFVLAAVAVADVRRRLAVAAAATCGCWRSCLALGHPRPGRRSAGITVLTDLNPWVVSFHLLCSLAIIGVCGAATCAGSTARLRERRARGGVSSLAWADVRRRLGRSSTSAPWSPAPAPTPATPTPRATASTRSRSASSTPTRCSCSSA